VSGKLEMNYSIAAESPITEDDVVTTSEHRYHAIVVGAGRAAVFLTLQSFVDASAFCL
jgi:hypothetical protein